MFRVNVVVGWTDTRPIVPDQHWSAVSAVAHSVVDATLLAAQMVGCRPQCQMVTSTTVLGVIDLTR